MKQALGWAVWLCFAGLVGACGSAVPHRLTYGTYDSAATHKPMAYSVYTPPGFSAEERLPVVVFLHGAGDNPKSIDEAQVGQELDVAIAKGLAPRVVLVSPQGDNGFWENWVSGKKSYRDWVVKELLPTVQSTYHTLPCPEGCHVIGISMGGHGALAFKLGEPALWHSVSVISAPIFTIDEVAELNDSFWLSWFIPVQDIWGQFDRTKAVERNVFTRWLTPNDVAPSTLLFAWAYGDSEQIQRSNRALQTHLREHQIEARSFVFPGGHNWTSWRPIFAKILRAQVPFPTAAVATAPLATAPVATAR